MPHSLHQPPWHAFDAPQDYTPEHRAYESRRHALFFSDPGCRALYRGHVGALLLRRNVYTGRLYRDDPTIMVRADHDEAGALRRPSTTHPLPLCRRAGVSPPPFPRLSQ